MLVVQRLAVLLGALGERKGCGSFSVSGTVVRDAVHIEPGLQPAHTPVLVEEAANQARMRAAAKSGRQ